MVELEARFQCAAAPMWLEEKCFQKSVDECPPGTRCFMKDSPTGKVYAACCCNRSTTPVDIIESHRGAYSCFADYVKSPESLHGDPPHCDILCCKRPGVARSCHGNGPICCDETLGSCGITLDGNACCASNHVEVGGSCCHALGNTCWGHWLVPFLPGSTCCRGDGCSELSACTAGRATVWTCFAVLTVLGTTWPACRERQLATSCRARAWQALCVLAPIVLTWLFVFIASLLALQQTRRPPAELQYVSAAWASWAAALVVLLRGAWAALPRGQRTESSLLQQRGESGEKKIAVIINIQAYLYMHEVVDEQLPLLIEKLRQGNWEVLPWADLEAAHVGAAVDQVKGMLRGTEDATVLICISSHSMSLFAVPHFLPRDARGFADGISIFWMLRELSTVPCKRPRFHVMLNGCMKKPSRLDRGIFRLFYGISISQESFEITSKKLLRNNDAQAWVLCACGPGRTVSGDTFTRKILEVLGPRFSMGETNIQEHYRELHRHFWTREGTEAIHPYLFSTGPVGDGSTERPAASEELSVRHESKETVTTQASETA